MLILIAYSDWHGDRYLRGIDESHTEQDRAMKTLVMISMITLLTMVSPITAAETDDPQSFESWWQRIEHAFLPGFKAASLAEQYSFEFAESPNETFEFRYYERGDSNSFENFKVPGNNLFELRF